MDKTTVKKFVYSPWGILVVALLVIVLVFAYASKIPGLGWLQSLGAKLPGSDAKNTATPAVA